MSTFPLPLEKSTELEFIPAKEAMGKIKAILTRPKWKGQEARELTRAVNLLRNMERRV